MLEFVNHDEYVKLTGNSIPADFIMLVREASAYLDSKTHYRIIDINENIKYVTCLLIQTIDEENKQTSKIIGLKSENVDGWSKTYSDVKEIKKEYDSKKYNIIRTYLINEIGKNNLPLLYEGVI